LNNPHQTDPFSMMQTGNALSHALTEQLLQLYDEKEARAIARVAAEETFGKVALRDQVKITEEQQTLWLILQNKLLSGMPLQYALGIAWFMDLKLKVTPDVLIPRPETEEMVALVSERYRELRGNVLDIGTGSGCIAIALQKKFPDAKVIGLDISEAALSVAHENAQTAKVNVTWLQGNILLQETLLADTTFSLIISNPPYIHPDEKQHMHVNVLHHEPHLALFTPESDAYLYYRRIAAFAAKHLQGDIWLETGAGRADAVSEILKEHLFTNVHCLRDMQGIDRFVTASFQSVKAF